MDWQTWSALAVVGITMVVMAASMYRKRRTLLKGGCGASCGCGETPSAEGDVASSSENRYLG